MEMFSRRSGSKCQVWLLNVRLPCEEHISVHHALALQFNQDRAGCKMVPIYNKTTSV